MINNLSVSKIRKRRFIHISNIPIRYQMQKQGFQNQYILKIQISISHFLHYCKVKMQIYFHYQMAHTLENCPFSYPQAKKALLALTFNYFLAPPMIKNVLNLEKRKLAHYYLCMIAIGNDRKTLIQPCNFSPNYYGNGCFVSLPLHCVVIQNFLGHFALRKLNQIKLKS